MLRFNRNLFPLLVAIALLALWYWRHHPASRGEAPATTPSLETLDGCPIEGDASNPDVRKLNRLKNRTAAPDRQEIDPAVTLEALLRPGDDRSRWSDRRGAEITGYVEDVKVGGVETVNCRATDPGHRDTHIELVLNSINAREDHRVIVEVTPRMRRLADQRGEDWSTSALRDHFHGRWVRVRGWLLFDTEHESQSFNTAPGRSRDWRATAWEIHPVTSLEVTTRPR